MTTRRETIIIEVRSDGTRIVRRNLDSIDDSAKRADRSITRMSRSSKLLRNTLVGLGSVLTAREILRYADAWTSVNNQLRANLPASANIANEAERVLKIAQDTRAPLAEVAKLYGQTSAAALELGASQDQVARLTEITGKSLAIAGSSAGAASGSILQLTQLLGGTVVQAQEFNSILDGNRPLLQAVASGIDRFGGSVSKLREEVKGGNFTVREFVEGALRGGAQIDERFATAVVTVGQATTQLDNAFTQFIGKVNDAEGGTDLLVEALQDLTAFFNDPQTVESAKVLGQAIVTSMRFALELVRDTTQGVKDLSEEIARLNVGGAGIDGLLKDASELDNIIQRTGGEGSALSFLNADLLQLENGFDRTTQSLARFERAERLLPPLIDIARPDELTRAVDVAGNQIVEVLRAIKAEQDDPRGSERNILQLERALQFWVAIQAQAKGLLQTTEKITEKVEEQKKVSTTLGAGLGATAGLSAEELAKLEKELSKIVSRVAPAQGAVLELARAEKILARASSEVSAETGKTLISKEREKELLGLLKKQYQDILDPLAAVNDELDRQLELLNMTTDEREVSNQLYSITEKLQRQGITLTNEENQALREKLVLLQDLAERQQVLDDIRRPQEEFQDRAEIVGQAVQSGDLTPGQGALDTVQNSGGLLDFEGTQTQLDAFVEQHRLAFEQIQVLRDQQLIDDQTANQLRMKADIQLMEQRLSGTRKLFGELSQLATSENKKLAAIGKAAAITQATIDGVLGVQKALASAPPPINFALAAAVGAVAAANVAQIASTRRLGGDLNEGQLSRVGEGTRPEIFRSSSTGEQFFIPPERGRVMPLKGQTENGNNQSSSGSVQKINVEQEEPPNVNVIIDPDDMVSVIGSGRGQKEIISVVRQNASDIKKALRL